MAFASFKQSIVSRLICTVHAHNQPPNDSVSMSVVYHLECMQPLDRSFAYAFMFSAIVAGRLGVPWAGLVSIPFISPFLGLLEMHKQALCHD